VLILGHLSEIRHREFMRWQRLWICF